MWKETNVILAIWIQVWKSHCAKKIGDALGNLVPSLQVKKRKKTPKEEWYFYILKDLYTKRQVSGNSRPVDMIDIS